MEKINELEKFEKEFKEEVIEVLAITGVNGVNCGKVPSDIMWLANIQLIAIKNLYTNEIINCETLLQWLIDDNEHKIKNEIIEKESVVRLKVREGNNRLLLVEVVDKFYKDKDLENILNEYLKPVYYKDEIFGEFILDKRCGLYEKKLNWDGEEGNLYIDCNSDMKKTMKVIYELVNNDKCWQDKIKKYAAKELLELANEWLQDEEEPEYEEYTSDIFVNKLTFESVEVNEDGSFEVYYKDGGIFWGHCIIVSGNINGEFKEASIAG